MLSGVSVNVLSNSMKSGICSIGSVVYPLHSPPPPLACLLLQQYLADACVGLSNLPLQFTCFQPSTCILLIVCVHTRVYTRSIDSMYATTWVHVLVRMQNAFAAVHTRMYSRVRRVGPGIAPRSGYMWAA